MSAARWGMSLVAVIGLLAATIAGATIWLLTNNPVAVSEAVSKGDVAPIVHALGDAIFSALKGLFKYL